MVDLYDRLDEIQGMTRVLTEDLNRLRQLVGEDVPISGAEEANRRFYVRAVFALVEAVVEQHKQLLLDLADRGAVVLPACVRQALSEQTPLVKDNGTVTYREQYLQLERKLRAVYHAAGEALRQPLAVNFGDAGWQSFRAALDVRDRITHPKTYEDCHVDGDALETVNRGHEWFRALNNEFVRVAREHRQVHNW
jgi:hypothetical protein